MLLLAHRFRVAAHLALAMLLCLAVFSEDVPPIQKVFWDIPAGEAVDTLQLITQEGSLQVMYSDASLRGIRTNPVRGQYEAAVALQILLRDTGLEIVQTEKRRIYAIQLAGKGLDLEFPSQTVVEAPVRMEGNSGKSSRNLFQLIKHFIEGNPDAGDLDDLEGNLFELSPFHIQASSNDVGYYAENTLAGSRLNAKVSDMAASITVVSRQQLEDTVSVDLNEVFLYEANTEGMYNYSAYEIDKDGAVEDIAAGWSNSSNASGPYSANRIRGVGRAATARNYFPSIDRIPFDSYNAATFEINRGPNSILFGLGNAAGIVNQSLSKALIGDNSTGFSVRLGSWGANRSSLNVNRTLIEGKLAVLAAGVRDDKGFRRKPSWDETRRGYLNVEFRPDSNTSVNAYFEDYSNRNRRPNTMTPRDLVTPWREAGSPVWNPLDRTVTLNGNVSGPYDSDDLLPGVLWGDSNRPLMYYDQGEFRMFTQRRLGSDPDEIDGNSIHRLVVSGLRSTGATLGRTRSVGSIAL